MLKFKSINHMLQQQDYGSTNKDVRGRGCALLCDNCYMVCIHCVLKLSGDILIMLYSNSNLERAIRHWDIGLSECRPVLAHGYIKSS